VVTPADADAFGLCIATGGVAVFPADTVYGLACDPESPDAVRKLYALKGRPPDKPAAVMWFDRDAALATLTELGPRTRAAVERLTPGGVTLLVPNPRGRFPLAAGPAGDGEGAGARGAAGGPAGAGASRARGAAGPGGQRGALGVRIPAVPLLKTVPLVVLQSSANHAGGPDARAIDDVPQDIRERADLVLDAGRLPGTPSTVIDLQRYEHDGEWRILREGAVPAADVARALGIVGRP
jgi:L-threonylcarbamoyladenylate synthase